MTTLIVQGYNAANMVPVYSPDILTLQPDAGIHMICGAYGRRFLQTVRDRYGEKYHVVVAEDPSKRPVYVALTLAIVISAICGVILFCALRLSSRPIDGWDVLYMLYVLPILFILWNLVFPKYWNLLALGRGGAPGGLIVLVDKTVAKRVTTVCKYRMLPTPVWSPVANTGFSFRLSETNASGILLRFSCAHTPMDIDELCSSKGGEPLLDFVAVGWPGAHHWDSQRDVATAHYPFVHCDVKHLTTTNTWIISKLPAQRC